MGTKQLWFVGQEDQQRRKIKAFFIFTVLSSLLISCNENTKELTKDKQVRYTIALGGEKLLADFYYKNSNFIKRLEYLDKSDTNVVKIDSIIFFNKNPNIRFFKAYPEYLQNDTLQHIEIYKENKIINNIITEDLEIFTIIYDSLENIVKLQEDGSKKEIE